MQRDTTWRPAWSAYYDPASISAHLEAMAAEGWCVERPGHYFWRYRRMTPAEVSVDVTYLADDPDPGLEPGGEKALPTVRWGRMCIIYRRKGTPAVEQDPAAQVEHIGQAMRTTGLKGAFGVLQLGVLVAALCLWMLLRDPVETLGSPVTLWLLPAGLLLIAAALLDVGRWKRWQRRAVCAAEQGTGLPQETHWPVTALYMVCAALTAALLMLEFSSRLWVLLALCLPVLLSMAGIGLVNCRMKRSKARRSMDLGVRLTAGALLAVVLAAGIGLMLVRFHASDSREPVGTYTLCGTERDVYADDIPLRLEELTETEQTAWSTENVSCGSLLLKQSSCIQWPLTQDPDAPRLDYTVTEVRTGFLSALCLKSLLEKADYVPADPVRWGAEQAFHRQDGGAPEQFLLCYGRKIVELSLPGLPGEEQMETVGKRLGQT